MGKKSKNKKRKVSPKEQVVAEKVQEIEKPTVQPVKVDKKKKPKKVKKEGKLLKKLKETGSELKKVSWPSFVEVLKKTGIVLAVVLFFGLILFGIDFGLSKLFGVLVP